MSRRRTFVERTLAGMVLEPDAAIDDEIDQWHDSRPSVELHEWLGMSWEEYALFVEKPWALRAILAARKTGSSLAMMVKITEGGTALAARGVPAEEFAEIRRWLKQTNRL